MIPEGVGSRGERIQLCGGATHVGKAKITVRPISGTWTSLNRKSDGFARGA